MVDSALKIFDEMCEKGIRPDEFTFNALSYDLSRVSDIKKLIKKMIVYTDRLDELAEALCEQGWVDEAKGVLDIMKQRNLKPSVFTLSYLMDKYCTQGRLKKARDVFDSLCKLDYEICPNTIGFSDLIGALCKKGLVDEAKEVVDITKQRNWNPGVIVYTLLMDGYCQLGRMDEARNVFDSLAGMNFGPDVGDYNTLIKGYCKKMKIDDAMRIFREMPRKGAAKPDVTTYNTILQGLFRGGRFSDALVIFDELEAVGLKPAFDTYSNMLKGLCKNGQFERASLFLDELERREGKCLDITYYNIIIECLCEAKKIDAARAIFRELASNGVEPNELTYIIMIKGCYQNGLSEEAKDLLVGIERASLDPGEFTYDLVVRGFRMRGKYDDAAKFLEEMVALGFSPDSYFFELMLDLLDTKKQDSPILKFIRKWAPSTLTREDGQ